MWQKKSEAGAGFRCHSEQLQDLCLSHFYTMPKKAKEKPKKTKKPEKIKPIVAVGRRKTATARVWLYPEKGPLIVGGRPIQNYFPGKVAETLYMQPFRVTATLGKFRAKIRVSGSGKSGQLGAVVHGLSRALVAYDSSHRGQLKKYGLLTRDDRMKERKKPGLLGARKAKQSPKR